MKNALCLCRALSAVFILAAAPSLRALVVGPSIPNPSFEANGSSFTHSPGYINGNTTITGWTASDATRVGLNTSGGAFADNGTIPQGSYVAFIQSVGPAVTLSTTISGLTIGTTYQVQFSANYRSAYGVPSPTLALNSGTAIPFSVSPAGYRTFTAYFTATANTAALVISNSTSTTDATVLVDNFSITAMTNGPINFVVTNTLDSGLGSLRRAFADAAAHGGPDTISFANGVSGTINLSAEIATSDPDGASVDATSIGGLTLDGGGSHRIFNSTGAGAFSLTNLVFVNGSASSGLGGAIFCKGGLTLNSCTFSGNTATTSGGAVFAFSALTVTGCTFTGNTTPGAGGAVMVSATSPLSSTFTSSTFVGNQATQGGGAITDNVTNEVVSITQCTIANNQSGTAGSGGGLDFSGTSQVKVSYSILANNTTNGSLKNYGSVLGSAPVLTANQYNLSDDTPLGFTGTDIVNSTTIGLGPLQNNGGPTQTMAIGPGSPAFDGAAGFLLPRIATDQRGFPVQNVPDIGAYESQASGLSLSAASYTAVAGYPLIVTVHRGGNQSGSATVRLTTTAGTAPATAFTARPDTTASDVVFSDGEADKDITINIAKSTAAADKTFSLTLGTPTAAGQVADITPSTATVTIKTPVTLQVTSTNDDGPGSLRQMVATAASTPAYNVITFAPALNGKTITLGSQIEITDTVGVTIDASSLTLGITLDGAGYSRLFSAHLTGSSFPRFALLGLTLTGGNNVPTGGGNGGAVSDVGYELELTRCTFAGNASNQAGGGVYVSASPAYCNQCTFSGNMGGTATKAGLGVDNAASFSCTECTFVGNTANNGDGSTKGAGAVVHQSTGRFSHCTFTANLGTVPGAGTGITLSNAHVTLTDCILANNGTDIVGTFPPYTLTLVGTNIIPVALDNGGGPLISGSVNGTGTRLTSDPMLGALASNGGPTQTVALLAGSPAINAATGPAVTADQRGLPIVGAADIGAFEVQTGGVFSFSQAAYIAVENVGAVTVTINRSVAFSGPATVKISTAVGTAGAADFTGFSNQVINFADGQTSGTVTIPITHDQLVEANETFTVKLSSPSAGSSLGTPASAVVVIDDPSSTAAADTTPPGIPLITSPAANAMIGVPTGGTLTLTGTATDNKSVNLVAVRDVNFNLLGTARLASPGAASTAWTATVTPVTGINTFRVHSDDLLSNQSAAAIRTITVLRPLVVNVSGYGTVTAGYAPSSYRQVGKPLTVTATVGAGYLFNGWTILSSHTAAAIGASNLALPALSFIHQEGLVLRANFVPSPYTTANTGVFNGGIDPSASIPTGGTAATLSTIGYVSATVQTSGAFTAALKLDGTSYAVTGIFDAGGTARFGTSRSAVFTIVRSGLPALFVTLGINTGTGIISGVVSTFDGTSTTASSTLTAERCPYNASHLVPAAQLGPVNADALYTIILPAITNQALGNANYPQGSGYASMKLTKLGAITVSGVLADGTPFSEATTLSGALHWRLFASLYGNKGLVAGNAAFGVSNYDFLATSSTWIRPVMDSQYYPGGWAGGLLLNVAGAKYTVTAGHSVVPGLDLAGDAELDFSDAGLTSTVEDLFTLSAADIPSYRDTGLKLTINRATGVYTGTFTAPDGTKPVFNGVVVNKSSATQCEGFFLTPAPKVKDYTGQSGYVVLFATP